VCLSTMGTLTTGADIPFHWFLLVGRLAALAPLLAQQQILEYHSEDTPGDTRFHGLPDQSFAGSPRVSRLSTRRLPSCVSPIESGFSDFLIRSVDGGSEDVWLSVLVEL